MSDDETPVRVQQKPAGNRPTVPPRAAPDPRLTPEQWKKITDFMLKEHHQTLKNLKDR